MTQPPYTPAQFQSTAFNCVYCGAYAAQGWGRPHFMVNKTGMGQLDKYWTCRCSRCTEFSFWIDERLVFPDVNIAAEPNPDLPSDIIADFEEARNILTRSPRGAAALLRLCIQKLCKELGEPGANINNDIGELVKKGLSPKIQKALDIVRVVGNNAVHPGQIELTDDSDTAQKLFGLVNLIADAMISQPKHVNELFDEIVPEPQKNAIAKRDGS